jgi:4a-hydroxytetrahydrobiopterin dehydratase
MTPLSDSEIEQRLTEVTDWVGTGEESIARDLTFADFPAAIAFVDRVAEIAEAQNHHPDILVHGWNKVRLELSTHSEGGVTDSDFKLAGEIDHIA